MYQSRIASGSCLRGLCVNDGASYMVAGATDGSLTVFEMGRPKQERFTQLLASYQGRPNCRVLAWRDSTKEIITGSEDGIVTVWSARRGHPLFVLQAHPGSAITQMLWLEDRQQLITCAKDKHVKVWSLPRIWYDEDLSDDEEEEEPAPKEVPVTIVEPEQ